MNWIVSHNNSYVEALTHNVIVFGDGDFREVIKNNEGVTVGP